MHITLLGPQRRVAGARAAVAELIPNGPVATINAGWRERETDTDELDVVLGGRMVNLELYRRWQQLSDDDLEYADASDGCSVGWRSCGPRTSCGCGTGWPPYGRWVSGWRIRRSERRQWPMPSPEFERSMRGTLTAALSCGRRSPPRCDSGNEPQPSTGSSPKHEFPILEQKRCTFAVRTEADAVFLRHRVVGLAGDLPLRRIRGIDLWYVVVEIPADSRVEYQFELRRGSSLERFNDPANPRVARSPVGDSSVCYTAGYRVDPSARYGRDRGGVHPPW